MRHRRTFIASAGAAAAGIVAAPFAVRVAQAAPSQHASMVFPAPETVSLPVVGENKRFPIRRIYCIGRNYLAHVEELNHDRSQPPLFFQKSRDMIVQSGMSVTYPSLTHDYEHEIELVLAMKSGGMNIPVDQAMSHVYGYAVGLDMTRRDLQNDMQSKRWPWEAGKSFDQAAPCSAITPVASIGEMKNARIHLTVNGKTATDGNIKDMIWSPAEVIAHVSTLFSVEAGDLIYTGTPAGVGKVQPGDVMLAHIDGLPELKTPIVAA